MARYCIAIVRCNNITLTTQRFLTKRCRSNSGLAFILTSFTVVGFVVFIIVPASIFYSMEDWAYGEALYCCFITVLTIGYADFVPGRSAATAFCRIPCNVYCTVCGSWTTLQSRAAVCHLYLYDRLEHNTSPKTSCCFLRPLFSAGRRSWKYYVVVSFSVHQGTNRFR